ncbi:MAG: hypothetical protein ACR2GE_02530 [Pseudonocardia sp.]
MPFGGGGGVAERVELGGGHVHDVRVRLGMRRGRHRLPRRRADVVGGGWWWWWCRRRRFVGGCLGCERRVERRYLPGVAESRRADLAPDPGDVGGVGRGHRGPPAGTAAWSCAAARSLPTRLATSDRVV